MERSATDAASVDTAAKDAARRRKRASFLGWLAEGGLPGLTGPVGPASRRDRDAIEASTGRNAQR